MNSMANRTLRVAAVVASLALLAPLHAAAQNPPGLGTLDHYLAYRLQGGDISLQLLQLRDQFGSSIVEVTGPRFLSPPAQKNDERIHDPNTHLTWYDIAPNEETVQRRVVVHNQFGTYDLLVDRAVYLLAPTLKNQPMVPPPFPPQPVDHFKCYLASGATLFVDAALTTQFGTGFATVDAPELLCNPAEKLHHGVLTPIVNPNDHLVCYRLFTPSFIEATVQFQDQFGYRTGVLSERGWFCVPSLKEIPTGTEATTWSRVRATYR